MTDAVTLREEARANALEAAPEFWRAAGGELRAVWNGCGPDAWPAECREALGHAYARYEPAMLVHDFDFATGDGSVGGFAESQERFERNMEAMMLRSTRARRWPLRWLARVLERRKIGLAVWAVEEFGLPYYQACALRRV